MTSQSEKRSLREKPEGPVTLGIQRRIKGLDWKNSHGSRQKTNNRGRDLEVFLHPNQVYAPPATMVHRAVLSTVPECQFSIVCVCADSPPPSYPPTQTPSTSWPCHFSWFPCRVTEMV